MNSASNDKKKNTQLGSMIGLGIAIGVGFLLAASASTKLAQQRDHLLFEGDFEGSDLSGWEQERCCDYSINVVDSPVRAGEHAVRFEIHKDQPDVAGSKRAEITLDNVPPTSERWYGFSIYLPNDYKTDPTAEIVTQWHAVPDFDKGEDWRSPPLALLTENGRWKVDRRWDARRVMPNNRPQGSEVRDLGLYERGRWIDWVVHVKWSWQDDGLLEVWKDGERVVHHRGPNAYNDEKGTYFKTGIYKWLYKQAPDETTTSERMIYVDEVRVGGPDAEYKDIAP